MRARWFKAARALRLYLYENNTMHVRVYIEWRPLLQRWDVMATQDGYPVRVLRTDDLFEAIGRSLYIQGVTR